METLFLSSAPGGNWLPFLFIMIAALLIVKGASFLFSFVRDKWHKRFHRPSE